MPTKQDTISRVMSAVMHMLHGSHLYGSSLWPEHGFKAGYPSDFTHDSAFIGAKIWNYPQHKEDDQWVLINMHSLDAKRIKEQGLQIDLIMENAIYDNVSFKLQPRPGLTHEYNRYRLSGIGSFNNHALQLIYTFTIND